MHEMLIPKVYSVSRSQKQPLLDFILSSLRTCGCTILYHSSPESAPFRITFEAPDGERMGIIVYAFLANSKSTKNRPMDEHRFQVKYGVKDGLLHDLWQDPAELYTTLFLGIHLQRQLFIGADPFVHSPTRFFISIEFKEENVRQIELEGWAAWERAKRSEGLDEPIEILVGGVSENFLNYVRFERAAKGLDQGHRALLADKMNELKSLTRSVFEEPTSIISPPPHAHALAEEFQLTQDQLFDLIQSAPRLKMAVKGWVAEEHLRRYLSELPDISECTPLRAEGQPDLQVRYRDSRPVLVECKNVLRKTYSDGLARVDFQRTRASKSDPCSRYYKPDDFDIVAACLHPHTEKWEFSFLLTGQLAPHPKCIDRLSNKVQVDEKWSSDPIEVLVKAC